MSQPTLATAGGRRFAKGYPGQVADLEPAQIQTGSNTSATAIVMGVAIAVDPAVDNGYKPWAADADQFGGISVRNPVQVADSSGNINVPQYDSLGALTDGVIFVQACEAVRKDDQALIITAGGSGNSVAGAIGGSKGGVAGSGRIAFPGMNAKWMDDTASGAVGRVRVKTTGGVRTTT